jgi:hypothetical protein
MTEISTEKSPAKVQAETPEVLPEKPLGNMRQLFVGLRLPAGRSMLFDTLEQLL